MPLLCSIGLHEWIYDEKYDPNMRICENCVKLEYNHPSVGWVSSKEIDRYNARRKKRTFEEEK